MATLQSESIQSFFPANILHNFQSTIYATSSHSFSITPCHTNSWMKIRSILSIQADDLLLAVHAADTGLTGRKQMVDTYGGIARHGGGAFSGKDPTKVDRSAAYAARYVAKNIVASKIAKKCEVTLVYVIGKPDPLAISIDTFGTSTVDEIKLEQALPKIFDLSVQGIISHLRLERPIYQKTSFGGHFGRNDPDFTWEKCDKAELLLKRI